MVKLKLRDIYRNLASLDEAGSNRQKRFEQNCFLGLDEQACADFFSPKNLAINLYKGKVRDVIQQGEFLYLSHSDRLTAFDRFISLVPFKGVLLAEIASFWFVKLQGKVPHHFVEKVHPRVLKVQKCDPIKVEVVVRGFLAGSMLRSYNKGQREFCGQNLPEGLKPYGPLPNLIITPTTKAAAFEHDEEISAAALIDQGLCTKKEWDQIEQFAFSTFNIGRDLLSDLGWMLIDTKYEFGRDKKGDIILIDEVHTPDSSRFWKACSYKERVTKGEPPEMLDKENVRRFLLSLGFEGLGDVPKVPEKTLLDLAAVYLDVAESFLKHELEYNTASVNNIKDILSAIT